ncbi:MAG: 2-C-methyl-D-erythritol 4-phosphate cytidylyltransferase [Bacteroidota bacterium]
MATPAHYALLMAGGVGSRMDAGLPKQMIPLCGRPILAHTLGRLLAFDAGMVVVTVLHASILPDWEAFVAAHFPAVAPGQLLACAGGDSRTASVHNGLRYLAASREGRGDRDALVAIHDGVRPFLTERMLREGFALAAEKGNAVAAVPVKSSLRMTTETGSQAIDRTRFFHVQTPQIFRFITILDAYASQPQGTFTDDASLAEATGENIHLFTGSYDNIKITTPEDLLLAERLLQRDS